MPFLVKRVDEKWKLYNTMKKVYVKTSYKSKDSAIRAGMNFMRYKGEEPYLLGNRILAKK